MAQISFNIILLLSEVNNFITLRSNKIYLLRSFRPDVISDVISDVIMMKFDCYQYRTHCKNKMNLDQFYTKIGVAEKYYEVTKTIIDIDSYTTLLEPSAGTGSFYKLLDKKRRIGIDLEPKCEGVKQMDFLEYEPDHSKQYLVIGNPPFGRVSSTAIKFFNKAAEFAHAIAFIVPRTFKRISVQNKLHRNFHLIFNDDIPLKPCAFTPNMNAKCCFQIWVKNNRQREIIKLATTHSDWDFLNYGPNDERQQPTPPHGADFALKAYGSNCGKICTDNLQQLRPKSWHWIKSNIPVQLLINRFRMLDYSISKDTVRQDSIGRGELVLLYSKTNHCL